MRINDAIPQDQRLIIDAYTMARELARVLDVEPPMVECWVNKPRFLLVVRGVVVTCQN